MKRLSIGEFARLTGLSVKALRWYDHMELLSPAHVDELTGYRSYHWSQFSRANRIRQMRGALLPLPDIQSILAADSEAQERDLLLEHQQRLLAEIDRQQQALTSLQNILNPQEEPIMELQVRQQPAQPFIASRVFYAPDLGSSATHQLDTMLMQQLEQLYGVAQEHQVLSGMHWWLAFPAIEAEEDQAIVDMCLATTSEIPEVAGVLTGTLPEREELAVKVKGELSEGELHPGVQAIEIWLAEQEREALPGLRQITTSPEEGEVELIVTLR